MRPLRSGLMRPLRSGLMRPGSKGPCSALEPPPPPSAQPPDETRLSASGPRRPSPFLCPRPPSLPPSVPPSVPSVLPSLPPSLHDSLPSVPPSLPHRSSSLRPALRPELAISLSSRSLPALSLSFSPSLPHRSSSLRTGSPPRAGSLVHSASRPALTRKTSLAEGPSGGVRVKARDQNDMRARVRSERAIWSSRVWATQGETAAWVTGFRVPTRKAQGGVSTGAPLPPGRIQSAVRCRQG